MKCSDFRAWVEECRKGSLTEAEMAGLLGCGVNSIARWKCYDPPYYIGLAIAALEAKLAPWVKPCR